MKLTPFHPIQRGAQGIPEFPVQCPTASICTEAAAPYVFDVVLRNRGALASPMKSLAASNSDSNSDSVGASNEIYVQGIDAACLFVATFGHNLKTGCFAHEYFGSEQIVRDLQKHPSWSSGYIVLEDYVFSRSDDASRRVVGMNFGELVVV